MKTIIRLITIVLKRTFSFVYHFISGSVLAFLFVFLFLGVCGILFVPHFHISYFIPYYVFFQSIHLGVCVIAANFGFVLLLLEQARKPTFTEELILGRVLFPILSERKVDALIGISIVEDDVHPRVFILDKYICFTTATVRKMSTVELYHTVNYQMEHFLDQGSRFLTMVYFAHIPYNLILKFLKFMVGASKRNKISHWTVGFLLEFSYLSLRWAQRVTSSTQQNKSPFSARRLSIINNRI